MTTDQDQPEGRAYRTDILRSEPVIEVAMHALALGVMACRERQLTLENPQDDMGFQQVHECPLFGRVVKYSFCSCVQEGSALEEVN